ncbi:TAXI family TRAP transporter solute-binding subunit [Sabulicella glaciei]|uniref:TAXI family TRAP transporter solute-binding subunit n=1 Tax=Sabulicella glaciei TaxID=2984948 RepID=A0ABT3NQ82_9PROT|nr:TAXI family TRAP transporter solute-binding subunit [Roseococcus sp. MDT2-1-1]MCW8084315.1 TAXI family TRAP transporter solute-binding subunit [Roseococcus sp. MDT2-1-1]
MLTRRLALLAGLAPIATPMVARAQQRSIPGLAGTQVWSVYDVGSTGYVEASAIADAMGRAFGTRVRLQPSGTSIGRVLPLKQKRASHGWLANELYFAVEGLYEYATPEWGPQDFRTLMGRKNAFSVVATKESGITKPEDLRGKRLAYVPANSSVNIKIEPILAFAGLTLNDVRVVQFPSYAASLRALIEGRADCAGAAPNAAVLRELEASPRGIAWVQLDPTNREGWAKAQRAVPFVEPFAETVGAGLSEQNPANVMGYRYPMITVNADAPDAEVYALMKAIGETFDLYKDVNPIMPRWAMNLAATPPMDAAFHNGAIRYLREAGIWNDTIGQWQDRTLGRQKALQSAWAEFLPDARGRNLSEADFTAAWSEKRNAAIARLS